LTDGYKAAGVPRDALTHFDEVVARMDDRKPALFLDYDGTLVPLAPRPELAVASADLRNAIRRLAALMPVAVVSGRGRKDAEQMLGVDGIAYAGSHGFDIRDAQGRDLSSDIGEPFRPALVSAAEAMRRDLIDFAGAFLEDKVYSLAIHYRATPTHMHDAIRAAVDEQVAAHDGLKRTGGKMIHELRPAIAWDKGTAVLRVMEALGLSTDTVAPIYIGDDETDEDAFRAIASTGIGIRVGPDEEPTLAAFRLDAPEDVRAFMDRLAQTAG